MGDLDPDWNYYVRGSETLVPSTYPLFGIGKASQILFLHPVEFEVLNLGPFRAYCLLLSFREFGQ